MLTLDTHTHNHGKVIHHGKNNALAKKDNLQQKEQSFFLFVVLGVMEVFMKSSFLLARMLVLFLVKSK